VQRSFTPERLTALAASPDGSYLAAGGGSGAVYLWDTPSGRLLATWPAHYKVGMRLDLNTTCLCSCLSLCSTYLFTSLCDLRLCSCALCLHSPAVCIPPGAPSRQ
jgi:WD40 repeat protein